MKIRTRPCHTRDDHNMASLFIARPAQPSGQAEGRPVVVGGDEPVGQQGGQRAGRPSGRPHRPHWVGGAQAS